jgi:hypothetical protein
MRWVGEDWEDKGKEGGLDWEEEKKEHKRRGEYSIRYV